MKLSATQKQQTEALTEALKDFDFASVGIGMDIPLKIPAQWFPSPISIPARKIGTVQVKHRTIIGETPIISMREAITRNVRPAKVILKKPLVIHELCDKDGVWMTDLPQELFQIEEALEVIQPTGRVLIGGLGLGIMALRCAQLGADVTVVEINSKVIKLCKEPFYRVVNADIFTYLELADRDGDPPFDHYLMDTWRGTGEATWWSDVMPLRRLIRNIHGAVPQIHCCAEEQMQGQVGAQLRKPNRHWHYEHLPPSMSVDEVTWFFANIGLPEWEKRYGDAIPRAGK